MVSAISDGIVAALAEAFDCPVYTERVEQGLEEPCFFVRCEAFSQQRALGARYHARHEFCISYFPKERENREEAGAVYERLLRMLEYIEVAGELTRGTGMQGEIAEGVLAFRVHYDFYVRRWEEEPAAMGEMEINNEAKG